MATEILSPPYPGEGTNPDLMFKHLADLAKWVGEHREELNNAIGRDIIPVIPPFPTRSVYQAQPISIMWYQFIVMRRVREEWDHLVRTYEDAWDCSACGRQRLVLVQTAAAMLSSAFIPYEHREAMKEREVEQIARMCDNLRTTLLSVLDPKYHDTNHNPDTGDNGG